MNTNKKFMDKEKDFDTWCKMLLDYTQAMVHNPTVANKWIFDRASHDEWVLSKFPNHLASVKAYNEFYDLTGRDIRDYDWLSSARTNDGTKIVVHQHFVDEHMTTAFDFKTKLLKLCEEGKLDVEKIKELISKQRLCWITKDENNQLNALGYRKHRENPLKAYEDCGIEIYDRENEDLNDIQTNPHGITAFSKLEKICPELEIEVSEIRDEEKIRRDFFDKLAQCFKENYPDFFVKYKNNCEHFDIRKMNDLTFSKIMVNVRVDRYACLHDICVYLGDKDAKTIYDKLYLYKKEIENEIGYELIWDRNNEKMAARIGRFGKYYTEKSSRRLNDPRFDTTNYINYDFDLDVEKVANELVNIYNVFMPRVKSILLVLLK